MPEISFTKAVALGNDFVIVDARRSPLSLTPEQIRLLANRRHGVGCDQVILILQPTVPGAYIALKFYNADGTEAKACGNGTRCVARLVMEKASKQGITIQTAETVCQASWAEGRGEGAHISVTLGNPRFKWNHIPLAHPEAFKELSYQGMHPACVSIGNPHAIFFVDDVDKVPLHHIGPVIETHPAFPERINVGFAQVASPRSLRLRVWERGAGYTLACGTGACAAAVVAIQQKLAPTGSLPIRVVQEGGDIFVKWQEGAPIQMRGAAHICFEGKIQI